MQFSNWAALIVPVLKTDGSIRISGDYTQTVNQTAIPDKYPLPKVDNRLASLAGGKSFTNWILLMLINSYCWTRNQASSLLSTPIAACFSTSDSRMESQLRPRSFNALWRDYCKVTQRIVCIDDVLVTGITEKDHLAILTKVLCRMSFAGMRLKHEKCVFMLSQVHYLRHYLSEGIQPTTDKIRAIRDAPATANLYQLKSFLGLINFYAKFLLNLCTVLARLYSLLQKD